MLHLHVCEKSSGFFAGDASWAQPALAAHAPSSPSLHVSPSLVVCRLPPAQGCGCSSSYRPDALMARVAAEWPSSREWMKTSVIFSPPMKVSCQGRRVKTW